MMVTLPNFAIKRYYMQHTKKKLLLSQIFWQLIFISNLCDHSPVGGVYSITVVLKVQNILGEKDK